MPPQFGKIERVARIEIDRHRAPARALEAGVTRIAGGRTRRQRHRLPRHRMVDRADIEIADRIGRVEREAATPRDHAGDRSEEHTSELQSLMRSRYAVFCLKKKRKKHIMIIRINVQKNNKAKEILIMINKWRDL